jgi:hypothetical protein
MTEYVILIVVIAIVCAQLVLQYGASVKALWEGAESDSVWEDVSSSVGGSSGGDGDPGCPYYFNAATGRWHDPATNLFVPFDDANSHGC